MSRYRCESRLRTYLTRLRALGWENRGAHEYTGEDEPIVQIDAWKRGRRLRVVDGWRSDHELWCAAVVLLGVGGQEVLFWEGTERVRPEDVVAAIELADAEVR